jgi:hypothetical protein
MILIYDNFIRHFLIMLKLYSKIVLIKRSASKVSNLKF